MYATESAKSIPGHILEERTTEKFQGIRQQSHISLKEGQD
jgi:hypothetical protein